MRMPSFVRWWWDVLLDAVLMFVFAYPAAMVLLGLPVLVGSSVLGLGVTEHNIPWGSLVVAAALSLYAALYRARRAARELARDRRADGLCEACGYDLRGSPARCPECGRPAAAAAAPTP